MTELERMALYATDAEKRHILELWGAKFTRLRGGRLLRAMVWLNLGEAEKPRKQPRRPRGRGKAGAVGRISLDDPRLD